MTDTATTSTPGQAPPTASRTHAAFAGVAAAAMAIGLGELIAAIVAARSAPLVAVGGLIIDKVPESGKELAIRLFGTYDKVALQVGTVVVLAAIAAVLGVLAARRLWIGLAGIAAFGIVGVASAVSRVGADVTWALPSLIGAVAAGVVLWLLLRLAAKASGDAYTDASERTRRQFLASAGVVLGGAAVVGYAGRQFAQNTAINGARESLAFPAPVGTRALAPPQANVASLSYVTSNETFYRIDTALVVPRIDPADWSLTIGGRVGNPLRLSFADLLKRPMIERYVTLACVSNEVGGDLIGNAKWLGVPLKDLLEEAQPDPAADQVVSRSVDGFTAGTPTKVLLDGRDAMIAVAMNDEPLPIDHGFPARMVVPGLYGYVSATKWLASLELTTFADFDAYWIPRGWAQQAPIKTSSRIDRPRAGGSVPVGEFVVAGVAWAQHRGISRVEVRVDNGPWQEAALAATASIDTWRLWSWTWNATPGDHTLAVRAYDNAGQVQDELQRPPAPDGATGYHEISVSVG